MIQILYTQDHQARAVALASVEAASVSGLIDSKPSKKAGLDTLTFWGHGDPFKFCTKTADELAKIIKEWKKENSSLKTVELITCNARHFSTGASDSFANQLKSAMRSGILSSTRDIKVKGLPVGVTGAQNAWSILLADPNTKSWVYVSAPGMNDDEMMKGQGLIRFHDVAGRKVSFNGDIAQRANEMVKAHPSRKWSMNYGYFNNLRKNLVPI